MDGENRAVERVRTILAARLLFDAGNITIDCQVKDLSPAGARIVLAGSIPVPNDFALDVPKRSLKARCRVVWRNADQMGVAFLVDDAAPSVLTAEQRIRQLEDENESLRALVKRLKVDLAQRAARDEQGAI